MCEFLSCVVVKDKYYYLEDKDVFSSYGRKVLAGCNDNDVLGHGAIRKYYNIKNGVGRDVEYKNFWELDKLPNDEIRRKVESFDVYFGKMFRKCFQNDDLCYVIVWASDEWREKEWVQLLKQGATNYDLCWVIKYASDEWREKAWVQLLKQGATNYALRYVIEYAPDEWKKKAWVQLLKQGARNDDLRYVIVWAPEKFKQMAKEELRRREGEIIC